MCEGREVKQQRPESPLCLVIFFYATYCFEGGNSFATCTHTSSSHFRIWPCPGARAGTIFGLMMLVGQPNFLSLRLKSFVSANLSVFCLNCSNVFGKILAVRAGQQHWSCPSLGESAWLPSVLQVSCSWRHGLASFSCLSLRGVFVMIGFVVSLVSGFL